MNDFVQSLPCNSLVGIAVFCLIGLFDRILEVVRNMCLGTSAQRLEDLRILDDRLVQVLQIWFVIGSVVVLTVGVQFERWLIAAVLATFFVLTPRWYCRTLIARREQLLRDQLASACFTIACGVKAGLALSMAIQRVANESPQPMAREFENIHRSYTHGTPLREAIEAVRQRLNIDSFALLAMGIGAAIDRGGRLDVTLERISHSIHEAQRLERRLDTETASGRRTIQVLTLFPLVFLGGFYWADPANTSLLFTTFPGQIALSIAFSLVVIAIRWAMQILEQTVVEQVQQHSRPRSNS